MEEQGRILYDVWDPGFLGLECATNLNYENQKKDKKEDDDVDPFDGYNNFSPIDSEFHGLDLFNYNSPELPISSPGSTASSEFFTLDEIDFGSLFNPLMEGLESNELSTVVDGLYHDHIWNAPAMASQTNIPLAKENQSKDPSFNFSAVKKSERQKRNNDASRRLRAKKKKNIKHIGKKEEIVKRKNIELNERLKVYKEDKSNFFKLLRSDAKNVMATSEENMKDKLLHLAKWYKKVSDRTDEHSALLDEVLKIYQVIMQKELGPERNKEIVDSLIVSN